MNIMGTISSFFSSQTTPKVDNTCGLLPLAAGIDNICRAQDYYGLGSVNSELITRAEKAIVDHVKSNNFQASTLSAVERDIRQKAEKELLLHHDDSAQKLLEEAEFFKNLQVFLTKNSGFLAEVKKLRQENPVKYLAILEKEIDPKIALFIDTLLGLEYEVNPAAPSFISGSRCFPGLISQWRSKTEGEVKKDESKLCSLMPPSVIDQSRSKTEVEVKKDESNLPALTASIERLSTKISQLNLNTVSIPELIRDYDVGNYDQECGFCVKISDYFDEESLRFETKAREIVKNEIDNQNLPIKNDARREWKELTQKYSQEPINLQKKELAVDAYLGKWELGPCSPKYKIEDKKSILYNDLSLFINENSADLETVSTVFNSNPIQYMKSLDSLVPNQRSEFFLASIINLTATNKEKASDTITQWNKKMRDSNEIAEKLLLNTNNGMSFVEKIRDKAVTDEEFNFLLSISKKVATTRSEMHIEITKAYKGRNCQLCYDLCAFSKKNDNIILIGQLRDLAKEDPKEYLRILNVIDSRRARLIDQLVMAGLQYATAIVNNPEFLRWREQKAMQAETKVAK